MPELKHATPGTTPATASLGETRVGTQAYRDVVAQAKSLLLAQELQRQARREQRWAELAAQLLQQLRAEGVAVISEEKLFVAAYHVVRGSHMAALSTAQSNDLRRVTRRVWTDWQQSRGIEEAITAEAASVSNSSEGRGSTVVVSDALDGGDRSSSPASAASCCDAPVLRAVECPRCFGQKGAYGEGGTRDEVVWFDCGQCEGEGTVPECESCGEVVS